MDSIIYFDPGEGCCELSGPLADTVLPEPIDPQPAKPSDLDFGDFYEHEYPAIESGSPVTMRA